MVRELNAGIGEVRIGAEGDLLKALLGSCVGIGLLWKAEKVCGLAHCLLPGPSPKDREIGARFVTQAIPSLLLLMKVTPDRYTEIEAVVAGGGNMTHPKAAGLAALLGTQNSNLAFSELTKRGIKVVYQDVGGEVGRRISILCSDYSYRVEKIPRIIEAA